MATTLEQALSANLMGITFYEKTYPVPTYLRLVGSDDGFNWFTIKQYDDVPELQNLRDPCLTKMGEYYYLICTGGLFRTKDFDTFEKLDYSIDDGSFANVWAPEFFQDVNANWHIIYAGNQLGNTNTSAFSMYVADFDPITGVTSNKHQPVNGPWQVALTIDPNITLRNGKYYLWISEWQILKLYTADNYLGPYTEIPTDIHNSQLTGMNEEGPEMIELNNKLILYDDPTDYSVTPSNNLGVCYSVSDWNSLGTWSDRIKVTADFKIKQFKVTVNHDVNYNIYDGQLFSFIKNFNSNIAEFFKRLNDVDQRFLDDGLKNELSVISFPQVTSNVLNRSAYLQVLKCLNVINEMFISINKVLNEFNVVDDEEKPVSISQISWDSALSLSTKKINYVYQQIDNNCKKIEVAIEASL